MTACCSIAATPKPTVRRGRRQGDFRVDSDATYSHVFGSIPLEGAVLRAEKNGTPFEEFEKIVFEKLLVSQPRRNEP